ncbi:hypothetical protein HA44_00730 [Mixta gaviniae]|nr:hypothetical protein HA44_00730 [Mixta gaviniae]
MNAQLTEIMRLITNLIRTGKVSGFKKQVDGSSWIITTLTHSLSSDGGFTTSLELEVKIDSLEME